MRTIFLPYLKDIRFSGDTSQDADLFLRLHALHGTAHHCRSVALEARRLAARFGADEAKAEKAGWLHDISAVIPSSQRVWFARELEIEVLPEEEACPMILHQKISALMAAEIFCIQDTEISSAIGCHTTLKAGASTLDKIVFIADKIRWDQRGENPWGNRVLAALEESLDRAVQVYLDHLWQQRQNLPVVHPWMVSAYQELRETFPGAGN